MIAKTKWIFGGQSSSQQPQDTKPSPEPVVHSADAKKFGLENFGNTCYANSVLQALYFCAPFRDLIIQTIDPSIPHAPPPPVQDIPSKLPPLTPRRKPERKASSSGNPFDAPSVVLLPPHPIPASPPTLFSALRSLFLHISTHPGDKGTIAPKAFIDKLKESKEDFRSTMHQDAHEFLNHLLNMIVEEIEEERKSALNSAPGEDLSSSLATLASKPPPTIATASSNSGTSPQDATLVHRLFEGVLTSETRCLTCETVSSRDESFLDLSIDIEQNSSVTACLRSFSASEMLCQKNKFFCDACCDLQEAEKRMKIKKLPNVLALHLKRFKFQEDVQKYIKLAYRVAFPFELRLFNTVDELENADRLYSLFAIVVHIGNGPHHGHYISIVKSAGAWLVFDDDNVYPIIESEIPKYYGDSNSGSAYVLYYQAVDIDLKSVGLKSSKPDSLSPPELVHPVGTQLGAPSQHSNLVPSFPPGLAEGPNLASTAKDLVPSTSPLVIIPPPSAPPVLKSSTSTLGDSNPTPNDLPIVPPGLVRPPTHNGIDLAPLRRPNTATPPPNDRSDKSTHSSSNWSPRHSISSPTLGIPNDSLPIPPIPPLPLVTPQTPVTVAQAADKGKDKDKDKSRKETKGWFKRRSFRVTDGPKGEKEKIRDESGASKDERLQSSNWFRNVSQHKQRAFQAEIDKHTEDGSSSKPEPPPAVSVTSSKASSGVTQQDDLSSSAPSIVLSSPPTSPSPPVSSQPSSSRAPEPNDQVGSPPLRKSSLASTPRSRKSADYRRNGTGSMGSFQSPRPATVAGTTPATNGLRPLPPIPSTTPVPNPESKAASPSVVNGKKDVVTEPESIYNASVDHEPGSGANPDISRPGPHRPTTESATLVSHTPAPIPPNSNPSGNIVGINTETSSTDPPHKRPTRKLSLTAPFGLGRRDKDRKEKVSPSSFMHRFDPRT